MPRAPAARAWEGRAVPRLRLLGLALALFGGSLGGCAAELESDLSAEEADEILGALSARGVAASKQSGRGRPPRYRVEVAREELGEAATILRAAELPRRREPGLMETFGEGALVPTPTAEGARYSAALGADLSRTLESMEGVVRARVPLALPLSSPRALDAPAPSPRASVLLRQRPGARIDAQRVRVLVAGAVAEMRPDDVAVIMEPLAEAEATPPSWVWIGPVATSRGTAATLKVILGGSLLLHLGLAGCLLFVLYRRRIGAGERRPSPPAPADDSVGGSRNREGEL